MPPPLGHPRRGIKMYYLFRKTKISGKTNNIESQCAPSPQRGTGGAKGGHHFMRENVFYRAKFPLKNSGSLHIFFIRKNRDMGNFPGRLRSLQKSGGRQH